MKYKRRLKHEKLTEKEIKKEEDLSRLFYEDYTLPQPYIPHYLLIKTKNLEYKFFLN